MYRLSTELLHPAALYPAALYHRNSRGAQGGGRELSKRMSIAKAAAPTSGSSNLVLTIAEETHADMLLNSES